jgi:hypothetical protein
MGKILKFEALKQSPADTGFLSLEVTLFEDGSYSFHRNGDLTQEALERLAEVIGAIQIKIIHDANDSEVRS